MKKLFDLAETRHAEIIKTAFLGAALSAAGNMFGRAALSVGKAVAANPIKTLGAAITGAEVAGGARSAVKQTEMAGRTAATAAPHFVGAGTI